MWLRAAGGLFTGFVNFMIGAFVWSSIIFCTPLICLVLYLHLAIYHPHELYMYLQVTPGLLPDLWQGNIVDKLYLIIGVSSISLLISVIFYKIVTFPRRRREQEREDTNSTWV